MERVLTGGAAGLSGLSEKKKKKGGKGGHFEVISDAGRLKRREMEANINAATLLCHS